MAKQTIETGLLNVLKLKALIGMPADISEVAALGAIVTHNANLLTELANKVDALENGTRMLAGHIGNKMGEHKAEINSLTEHVAKFSEATADALESLTDQVGTIDDDVDGMYDDFNQVLFGGFNPENGGFVRNSEVAELKEEAEESDDEVTTIFVLDETGELDEEDVASIVKQILGVAGECDGECPGCPNSGVDAGSIVLNGQDLIDGTVTVKVSGDV